MYPLQCKVVILFCIGNLFLLVNEVNSQNSVANLELQNNNQKFNKIFETPAYRDPDAITYPDELLKDSYGNPVTPFSQPKIDIGHMTDVNKPDTLDTRTADLDQGVKKDPLGFVLPSYAGGITKIETLGPNVPSFPLIPPTRPNVEQQQPTTFTNLINQSPSDKILPPFRADEQRFQYHGLEINTQPTLVYVTTGVQSTGFSPIPPVVKPTPAPAIPPNNDEVYRGTFGGASGILGDQNTPGYAVKPSAGGRPIVNPPPPPSKPFQNPPPTIKPDPPALPFVPAFPNLPPLPALPVPANNAYPKPSSSILPPIIPQFNPPLPPLPQKPTLVVDKSQIYSGTFGGPPGILSPYDNVNKKN